MVNGCWALRPNSQFQAINMQARRASRVICIIRSIAARLKYLSLSHRVFSIYLSLRIFSQFLSLFLPLMYGYVSPVPVSFRAANGWAAISYWQMSISRQHFFALLQHCFAVVAVAAASLPLEPRESMLHFFTTYFDRWAMAAIMQHTHVTHGAGKCVRVCVCLSICCLT